jgi:hypothetical protein
MIFWVTHGRVRSSRLIARAARRHDMVRSCCRDRPGISAAARRRLTATINITAPQSGTSSVKIPLLLDDDTHEPAAPQSRRRSCRHVRPNRRRNHRGRFVAASVSRRARLIPNLAAFTTDGNLDLSSRGGLVRRRQRRRRLRTETLPSPWWGGGEISLTTAARRTARFCTVIISGSPSRAARRRACRRTRRSLTISISAEMAVLRCVRGSVSPVTRLMVVCPPWARSSVGVAVADPRRRPLQAFDDAPDAGGFVPRSSDPCRSLIFRRRVNMT